MLETFTLFIPTTNSLRTIRVYRPHACLKEACDILFMHDAQNLFDDSFSYSGFSWRVKDAIEQSTYTHLMVVGIDNHPKERMNEYSPFFTTMHFTDRDITGSGGKGFAYIDFIVDSLLPEIKRRYQTTHTYYMAGSSMGAYISMFAAIKYPKLFSAIGSFSIASWFNEHDFLLSLKESNVDVRMRFWVSVGSLESSSNDIGDFNQIYIKNSQNVLNILKDKGVTDVHYVQHPGEHSEKQWMELFPTFIAFLQNK